MKYVEMKYLFAANSIRLGMVRFTNWVKPVG